MQTEARPNPATPTGSPRAVCVHAKVKFSAATDAVSPTRPRRRCATRLPSLCA